MSVFLFPPSWEELERRLTERATDDDEAVRRRLGNARGEVKLADRYSYWLVNDDLDRAVEEIRNLVRTGEPPPGGVSGRPDDARRLLEHIESLLRQGTRF